MTVTFALASMSIVPNAQVAVSPVTEQLPSELVRRVDAECALLGSVTVNAASCAAVLPVERTTNGSVNGRPPSPVTEATPASTATSAYSASVTQLAVAITGSMVSRLHWENVAKPLTDGAMMKPPPMLAQAVPASPSCGGAEVVAELVRHDQRGDRGAVGARADRDAALDVAHRAHVGDAGGGAVEILAGHQVREAARAHCRRGRAVLAELLEQRGALGAGERDPRPPASGARRWPAPAGPPAR